MAQIGHKSAKLTLEVYTDADNRRDHANEQIGTLLRTPEWAQRAQICSMQAGAAQMERTLRGQETPK